MTHRDPEAGRSGLLGELDAMLAQAPDRSETAPAPAPEAPREKPAEAAAGGAPRVLVAEDNADFRRLVRTALSDAGYDVLEAADGAQALELAISERPAAAVLDFDMPALNGYELVRELRAREETRGLGLVMLSGARFRAQLRQLGLDVAAVLEKPSTTAELLAALASCLGAPAPAPREERPPAAAAGAEAPDPLAALESGVPEEDAFLVVDAKHEADEAAAAGLDALANDSSIIGRINKLLVRALEAGASDVHFEPQEKRLAVRIRVDGELRPLAALPATLAPQIAARLKIMASLVITERRRPQDGQIRATVRDRKVDFRVSTVASLHGETIVLRILGGGEVKETVAALGLRPRDQAAVERAIESPHGLILATGPTGSGKTTTLYTLLRELARPNLKVMTVEDPVEYELPEVTQVPVRPQIGVTFESVLRSFLRQDPDVMLVGEIRDAETAEIAVKAAITGHLVLSTLHTNTAASAVTRLTNMGVPAYLLADSLRLVVAQRLLRRLCPACREPAQPDDRSLRLLREDEAARLASAMKGRGCPACARTGYAGRLPVFEVLEVRSPELRALLQAAECAADIARLAAAEGMQSLRAAALEAAAAGETSVEEALGIILSE